jgi:hypothetical protein
MNPIRLRLPVSLLASFGPFALDGFEPDDPGEQF